MRVVFLTHNYPRFAGDVAGNFLHPLAASLVSRGVPVSVFAPSEGGKGGDEVRDGVSITRVRYGSPRQETLAYKGTMRDALRSPGGLHALAGMIRAFTRSVRREVAVGGDVVVHAHWWVPSGLAVPKRVPMVVTCHGTDVRLLASSTSFNFFGKRVLRRARVVTTVSSVLARTITERTGVVVESEAIRPMPIVDIDRPRSQGGGGVIMLGRLTDQKRVDLALEGYASARDRGLKLPLRIVGDGPARASLQVHAGGLGLKDSVTFVGAVQPEDVPKHLANADLCLMTAKDEGLGLAAAEALVQGIPVVGCEDGGGLLDVVRLGAGGVVVAPSAEAIGDALLAAIDDRQLHADAAEAGKGWQTRLSPSAVAECCEEWYRQALEARL